MLQAKQIPAPEPATPTVATRRSGWRAPARKPARRTNCRVGGGGGPEDAPGAGAHHEAGEVGHGECVDVGVGEEKQERNSLNLVTAFYPSPILHSPALAVHRETEGKAKAIHSSSSAARGTL